MVKSEVLRLERHDWTVAIFAARETAGTLASCLQAALKSCGSRRTVIDVLVNGNRALADQFSEYVDEFRRRRMDNQTTDNAVVRVWFIPFGDKAHAWNVYLHTIWPGGDVGYFIDGYVQVRPDAFLLLDEGLTTTTGALGATGIPTSGRSARNLASQMLTEGGMHGNLHAIRGSAISNLKQTGFRLPLGLYRTDSLIGAVLMFRLDPAKNEWDPKRVFVHPQVTWHVASASLWTLKDLSAQYKRKLRQAQGALENRAVREHLAIGKRDPVLLPRTTNELVNRWLAAHPEQATQAFVSQPLTFYAARKLRQHRDWSIADLPPVLAYEFRP
ncbi:MAG TPA: hypothetical protein VGU61_01460 [Noviherbaspirillum sp.]|uniref:hypothetical protein n=1 Tax=Noviherbaspirillum sp. TaxID=1926288 RepID=UPI002DDD44FF|nr:hypothetical protein [Noviherbaspirillum sp.]HEV2608905.1 hypothetical protein [Noviherbaspirillum sp.]